MGKNIMLITAAVLVLLNIYGFTIAGIDKERARKRMWRIRESTFFIVSLMGGSIGVYLGLIFFRHKTRHWYFMLGIPIIILVQILVILYLSHSI